MPDRLCDNAAKTLGSNHLKHIAGPFPATMKKPARMRAFSYSASPGF
jgi:hypothetical protein